MQKPDRDAEFKQLIATCAACDVLVQPVDLVYVAPNVPLVETRWITSEGLEWKKEENADS
ncbi:MAG: hypothetical protein ABSH41_24370 [Syntrophobacteraceae bacterium]|jgi:hypothetical protein